MRTQVNALSGHIAGYSVHHHTLIRTLCYIALVTLKMDDVTIGGNAFLSSITRMVIPKIY